MRSQKREEMEARVRETLSSLDPIVMSETERSDLRRAVWSEIRSPAPDRTSALQARRVRLAGAAAVVAALLGVAVLSDLGGQDNAFDMLSGASGGAATTAAAAENFQDGPGIFGRPDAADGGSEDGDAPAPAPPEPETVLMRYAELVRTGAIAPAARADDIRYAADSACGDADGLDGMEPVAVFEVDGVEYQAWVPEGEKVDADTAVTFVEAGTCRIVATE
ncbi:MAG TPA: hypothetical protein VF246_01425 [Acidimicrobiia bacterium]